MAAVVLMGPGASNEKYVEEEERRPGKQNPTEAPPS